MCVFGLFFASRRRHTSCALVTGVQTCALPICGAGFHAALPADLAACVKQRLGKARLARATRPDERNDPHCAAFSFHDCISSSARRSPHSYGRRYAIRTRVCLYEAERKRAVTGEAVRSVSRGGSAPPSAAPPPPSARHGPRAPARRPPASP